MGAREGVVLRTGCYDAGHRRIRRQIDLEEISTRNLTGEADIGNGDLLALAISAGFLLGRQMLLQAAERRLVPVLRPFLHARLVDLEFLRKILAHAWHD